MDIKLTRFKCKRPSCRHEWFPRKKKYPTVCPKCKSPYWDKDQKTDDK